MKTFTHITIFILFLISNSMAFCSSDFLSSNRIIRSIQDYQRHGVIKQITQVQQIKTNNQAQHKKPVKIKDRMQPQNHAAQPLPDWQISLMILEPFNKHAKKSSADYIC